MYSASALADLHERAHRTLRGLILHCGLLTEEEIRREIPGFGYPSVLEQLDHVIGAEEYWVSVARGRYKDEEERTPPTTIEALEEYRRKVAAVTAAYLGETSDRDLNAPREMWTWPGKTRTLVPAHLLLRTQTHIYAHTGQVLAMCRQIGKPSPGGLDFPLD